jgi:hypothetical protein
VEVWSSSRKTLEGKSLTEIDDPWLLELILSENERTALQQLASRHEVQPSSPVVQHDQAPSHMVLPHSPETQEHQAVSHALSQEVE